MLFRTQVRVVAATDETRLSDLDPYFELSKTERGRAIPARGGVTRLFGGVAKGDGRCAGDLGMRVNAVRP